MVRCGASLNAASAWSVLRCQSSALRMMVGLISTTSSFLRAVSAVLPSRLRVTTLPLLPGRPDARRVDSLCISPPMATMLPSCTRTTVSVSLTLELASGRR